MAYDPVKKVWDDVESYSPEADLPAFGADIMQQVSQGQMPALNEQALYAALQKEAMAQKARQQGILEQMAKREQEYAASNKGMSPTEKAALMFQAAGALAAPTRTGAFGESLGALGTAISGPLLKQAEADRARQEKLMQLQMAREKMALEMPTGEVGASELMKLYQLQQANKKSAETFKLEEVDGQPVLVGSQGTVKPVDRTAAGLAAAPKEGDENAIPPQVRAAGPSAIKAYQQEIGKKTATEMSSALSAADSMKASLPIIERAEKAYSSLADKGGIGPYVGSAPGQFISKYTKSDIAKLREDYTAAGNQLQTLKARIEAKGQGAITDFERRLLALQLPTFDAQDPETGLETLRLFKKELQSVIEKPGRIQSRGEAGQAKSEGKPAEEKKVVRTGTITDGPNKGKKVIEYSDGSREIK